MLIYYNYGAIFTVLLLFFFTYVGEPLADYALPFQSQVPPDPTLEDMTEFIVGKEVIPEIPETWSNSEVQDTCTCISIVKLHLLS